MRTYNPAMQKAHLNDVESDNLDGVSVTQVTFATGAHWSSDLKGYAGTDLCELPHVAVVIAGTLGVRMADGSEEVFSAGDVMLLPPGHDAWTAGDGACTFVEFSRGSAYYADDR